MDLDVRRLRLLREVALRGTIAAAADALGFTPSAVSQQLSTLERESATALLERSGRTVRLTDAGRLLVERTGPVLVALEEAQAALEASRREVGGGLRVRRLRFGGAGPRHPGRRLRWHGSIPSSGSRCWRSSPRTACVRSASASSTWSSPTTTRMPGDAPR